MTVRRRPTRPPEFKQHLPATTHRRRRSERSPEIPDAARAGFVTYLVSVATGVEADRIAARTRQSARAARARQIAMYLAHVGFSWPLVRVGAAFGRDRTTAGHACHRVEDLRDHPAFDAAIDTLEACIRAAPTDPAVSL